jgi:CHAT domain
MSVSLAESKIKSCRTELARHRDKQATEEARAVRLDSEAAGYEEQASRSSSASLIQSKLRSADRKRKDALRAREAAAKASKAVAAAQKKLHDAEADLARKIALEQKRTQDKEKRARVHAERERKAEKRRQQSRERELDQELAALRGQSKDLEAQLRLAPWAQSPEEVAVLFIAASPEDQQPLRLDKEVREIQQRVRMSDYREAVEFHWKPATQVADLLQALNEVRPHIVHFSGHGSQGALIFEDSDGQAKPLSNSDLAQLLHISSDRIRLAVFNSCESVEQAALACDHIDAAIGMQEPVDDEAAKVFAGQFYNALGFGKSLQEAFDQAGLQVKLTLGGSSGEPQLHTASGIEASLVYLVKPSTQ